jgi:hypothetical protein
MASGQEPSESGETIQFHFVRSPHFRVIHSNGAWGGVSPHNEISVTFYSERRAFPQQVTQEISVEGRLGDERGRIGPEGIEREMEVQVMMSMEEAIRLHSWLGGKIEEWRSATSQPPS